MESKELNGGSRHPGAVGQGEVGEASEADWHLDSGQAFWWGAVSVIESFVRIACLI